jgi:MFS transporter, ACS family, hexuronate transporter
MKIPHLRWWIAGLLFLSTVINYADRLTLSVVSQDVRSEFGLSEQDYSHVVTAFLAAYAIMYAGSGYLLDRMGTRRGFAFFIAAWSFAQMLHGFVRGKWSLAGSRFLLGLAEPGAWPAAAKAVSEWFPADKRAFAMGIFNAGSSIGSAIAPPMVAYLTLSYGWRAAFFFTGALGLVWLIFWLILYESPRRNRWLRREELAEVPPEPTAEEAKLKPNWLEVIKKRGCYSLILARFFTDPVIYFVIFWLPEYLRRERNFDLKMVGDYAWVPFIFGDIGYMMGGYMSGFLMKRGWTLPRARKRMMLIGAAVMPAAILAPLVPTAAMAIAATCFVTLGHAIWVANLQTLPTDLFPRHEVGTATGFSGMGGAIGGMLANLGTGWVVMHYSYAPIFIIAGLMHPLSALIVFWLLPDREFERSRQANV